MRHQCRALSAVAVIVAFAVGLVANSPVSAARWNYETLDGNGVTGGRTANVVGLYSDAVVWSGEPHVFYADGTAGDLRHAWWSGTSWNFETLDGNGGTNNRTTNPVGATAAATVWNNAPHVWYFDDAAGDLRHAWWSGSTWIFEILDGAGGGDGRSTNNVGAYASVTVWNNQPHVFYRDISWTNLRHGWWTGAKWQFETLDGDCTSGACAPGGAVNSDVGEHTEVTVWNNQPHVFYYDNVGGDLRHGWWTGSRWQFETLDGQGGTDGRTANVVGRYASAAVWNNQPHVFYMDSDVGDLRHAWWTGTKWQFETLDGNCPTSTCVDGRMQNEVGFHSSVAIWNNEPHAFYTDDTAGDLRHAWYG